LARGLSPRSGGDRGHLASHSLAPLLDLEEPATRSGRPRLSLEVKASSAAWPARTHAGVRFGSSVSFVPAASTSCIVGARLPSPGLRRPPSTSWRAFLRLHAHEIWPTDFFTLPTLTFRTLSVFIALIPDRRRIVRFNVTAHPTADWVWRQVIQATPWGTAPHFLIRDRDRSYGRDFALRAAGIEAIQTPVRAPKANAFVERAISTLRRECTDHIIVLGEQHPRGVLREYVAYYNNLRAHRSLLLEAPVGPRALSPQPLRRDVISDPVLGGLHHVYRWAA